MSNNFLYGTIREIKEMPFGVQAAIALDTDDDHALCIVAMGSETGKFGVHFNIQWLEHDTKTVDWLARVIGRAMQTSYRSGLKNKKEEMLSKLSGLKELLQDVSGNYESKKK